MTGPDPRAHLVGPFAVAAVLLASGLVGFLSYRFLRPHAATPGPAALARAVPPTVESEPAVEPAPEASAPATAKVPDRLPEATLLVLRPANARVSRLTIDGAEVPATTVERHGQRFSQVVADFDGEHAVEIEWA